MNDDLLQIINPIAWVIGNLLIAYVAFAVLVFVISYYILFDPRATTAGKLIFRFFLSLVGIIALVFIGTWIDPVNNQSWLEIPSSIDLWRPVFRVIVYGYVSFTLTSLAVLLARRKWWPKSIKTAPDQQLVQPRHDTSDIPTVKRRF